MVIASFSVAGCSDDKPIANDVDVNAAAAQAQGAIANYAAGSHERRQPGAAAR